MPLPNLSMCALQGRIRLGFNAVGNSGGIRECSEIRVALRQYANQVCFRPYEEILDTMLHELAHNTYDGHPPAFWRLYHQYQQVTREAERGLLVGGSCGAVSGAVARDWLCQAQGPSTVGQCSLIGNMCCECW